jgi:hypothetical protein
VAGVRVASTTTHLVVVDVLGGGRANGCEDHFGVNARDHAA